MTRQKVFHKLAFFFMFFFPVFVSGCAPAILALGTMGTGVSKTTDYYRENTVTESITCNIDLVNQAALAALKKMEIPVVEMDEIDRGREIIAKNQEMKIVIDLERLTPNLTHLEVIAKCGLIFRDKATAQEVADQSILAVERLMTRAGNVTTPPAEWKKVLRPFREGSLRRPAAVSKILPE